MVSPNKASVDLRESVPLSRNILHTGGVTAYWYTGQRTNREVWHCPTDYRSWLPSITSPKVSASYLNYLADVRDSAKSGLGRMGNRHLRYLVESISVNVGGSDQNVKESSPLMSGLSVGGVIVVGARESRVQGEGHQGVNPFLVER